MRVVVSVRYAVLNIRAYDIDGSGGGDCEALDCLLREFVQCNVGLGRDWSAGTFVVVRRWRGGRGCVELAWGLELARDAAVGQTCNVRLAPSQLRSLVVGCVPT